MSQYDLELVCDKQQETSRQVMGEVQLLALDVVTPHAVYSHPAMSDVKIQDIVRHQQLYVSHDLLPDGTCSIVSSSLTRAATRQWCTKGA